jgi:hypothetical protein
MKLATVLKDVLTCVCLVVGIGAWSLLGYGLGF